MGRGSFGNAIIRIILAVGFFSLAWLAIGPALSLGLFGESAEGTVVGYWMREPTIPLGDGEAIQEPDVQVPGRSPSTCDTVYRGYQRDRELPGRGATIQVRYWPDALARCYATSTIHAPWRLGLGTVFALVGLMLAGSGVEDLAV
ncbi:MAG: hypothetical protein ABEN55_23160 [Bradymonadaceae bacterium]